MAVAKFQKFILPTLQSFSDGKEKHLRETYKTVADDMKISDEERKILVPSGTQLVYENRISWARTYLKKAGLLKTTKRGYAAITDKGREVVQSNPAEIKIEDLRKYSEFETFFESYYQNKQQTEGSKLETTSTPTERFQAAYEELRQTLREELQERVMHCSWIFFERLVVDLLINLGYGGSRKEAGKAFTKSADEGIDGLIKEDKLGLDLIYVQAKRWKKESHVGRPEIQKFAGALQGKKSKKGVFITTSYFSKDARSFAEHIDSKIILIDSNALTDYMIDSNTGVTVTTTYDLKRIDSDYFEED